MSAPKHANIARRAEAAIGRRATTDRTLLATVFEAHPLASADSATAVWRNTRARRSSPKRGDLLVFLNDGAGPQVAVVLSRDAQGLEAAAVTRGAVRRIRVDPKRPNTRRRGKKVVNTFLRPRRSDDSAKTRYLAGARLLGVRSY